MTTTTTNTVTDPAIWVGCLACYNAGRLQAMYPDGDQAGTAYGWVRAEEWEGAEPVCPLDDSHEEFEIMDTDNFAGVRVDVYDLDAAAQVAAILQALEEYAETSNTDAELLLEVVSDHMGDINRLTAAEVLDELDDAILFACEDEADWAATLAEDTGSLAEVPEQFRGYIDWSAVARDARYNGEVTFYGTYPSMLAVMR